MKEGKGGNQPRQERNRTWNNVSGKRQSKRELNWVGGEKGVYTARRPCRTAELTYRRPPNHFRRLRAFFVMIGFPSLISHKNAAALNGDLCAGPKQKQCHKNAQLSSRTFRSCFLLLLLLKSFVSPFLISSVWFSLAASLFGEPVLWGMGVMTDYDRWVVSAVCCFVSVKARSWVVIASLFWRASIVVRSASRCPRLDIVRPR